MVDKAKTEDEEAPGLPGKVSTVDGVKHTEGYGPWPTCDLCGEQVEPTGFTAHQNEHARTLRG